MNRTLLEKARCLLSNDGLTKSFWVEAMNTTCYLVNRSPSTAIGCKTPIEVWSTKPANYSILRISSCHAYYHVNEGKLEPRSRKGLFMGYGDGVKGYRIWSPSEKTYEKKSGGDVFMGNDMACKTIGIRTIQIKMHDGVIRTLTEVRHVPDLKKNLISVGVLDTKGFNGRAVQSAISNSFFLWCIFFFLHLAPRLPLKAFKGNDHANTSPKILTLVVCLPEAIVSS
uniref:Retrovirus-related Pol polyprotein from transposon TNT 1-94 n=1 Tax=Cajanus cajan TaxID=3821 RepID=A0A151R841_CAJCA|nr:Retrovirus-related Pol polyprotein from transposon TNT 1-94 [Cajanus cajan]